MKKEKLIINQSLDYGHAGTIWDSALSLIFYIQRNFE
jgi:hypothetical protein